MPATPTPGPPSNPTATPTNESPFAAPCRQHEILASYSGTARWINTIGALTVEALGGPTAGGGPNGQIFSNGNVEFQIDSLPSQVAFHIAADVREVINGFVGVYGKDSGYLMSSVTLRAFFRQVDVSVIDPRVLFDQKSERWVVMAAKAGACLRMPPM